MFNKFGLLSMLIALSLSTFAGAKELRSAAPTDAGYYCNTCGDCTWAPGFPSWSLRIYATDTGERCHTEHFVHQEECEFYRRGSNCR